MVALSLNSKLEVLIHFVFTNYLCILCLSCKCQKVKNLCQILQKITEKKQHSGSFQGRPLSSPSYTVTVSYCSFHLNQVPVDCIPVYLCTRPIKQILISMPLLYSK